MEKELLDFAAAKVDEMLAAGSASAATKAAAQAWKDAVAADGSDAAVEAATNALLDFLEGRMLGIDDLIAFAEGPAAGIMGAEAAAGMLEAAKARKAEGWKYCICEAHTAAAELLGKFGRIEL